MNKSPMIERVTKRLEQARQDFIRSQTAHAIATRMAENYIVLEFIEDGVIMITHPLDTKVH